MASAAVAVKAPVAWSVRGSYQFPAPPRPVWAYSCGEAAVVVVVSGEAPVEVGGRFASRSCGREGVSWVAVVRLGRGGEGVVVVGLSRAAAWSRLGAVERLGLRRRDGS